MKMDWKMLVSVLALLLTIAGTVYNAGSLSNKIDNNTKRFDAYVLRHSELHAAEHSASNERYNKITVQLTKLMDMTVETQKSLASLVAVNNYMQRESNGTDKTK